jgi:DNA mismatch repair protein MutS2
LRPVRRRPILPSYVADLLPLRLDPCPAKTRGDLELDRLLAALASRTRSVGGRALAVQLPFARTREEVRSRLTASTEATTLHAAGEPLPVTALGDTSDALGRLKVGGVLAPEELRRLAELALAARTLRRFLQSRRGRAPTLFEECATDPTLDEVGDEVHQSFDPAGTLADDASPRLRELRGEYLAARGRMLSRLEELMTRYEGILQDRFITEREGRYVVPVRSDAHERFPGIVHATSNSGSTLFVEPRAVIPMGNRLKMLEADVMREEAAIYARLSGQLGDVLPSLEEAAAALARADVRAAIAVLAEDLDLRFPEVIDAPRAELRDARHPLLVLDAVAAAQATSSAVETIVPSDLVVQSGRAVVVSGPNAGGKTVALKALGLSALMLRAGLPIAAAEGSKLGIFDVVLTDVGDDQSLHQNLSTFSAHVKNLVAILDEAQPGALVLLDELAGGTDPREGEALAAGVLDSLCARGAAVCATTHYEGLKALALADDRFENASVGFDLSTMTPTFRLALGVPGSSSALAVARRYGMPSTVLERAERFGAHDERRFDQVVQGLNDERAALGLARQAAETREREAHQAKVRLEAELAQLRDQEQRTISREVETLLASVRKSREELRQVQFRLRAKRVDEQGAREAQKAIERIGERIGLGGDLERHLPGARPLLEPRGELERGEVKRGSKVYVPRLRADAEVVELLADGQLRVAAGAMKLVVSANEVRRAAAPPEEAPRDRKSRTGERAASPSDAASGPSNELPLATRDNSVDVRGMRADDAVALATTFLDRSLNDGRRVAFVVHGHGTGALREAIRSELKASPYVARFRAGDTAEGGDGVTVVWLS